MKPYKESIDYFSKHPAVRPKDVVMAFTERHSINEVFMAGPIRYRITGELTRKEFLKRLRANQQMPNCVAAEGSAVGSKIDIESARDVAEPGPEFTHYYAAEPV